MDDVFGNRRGANEEKQRDAFRERRVNVIYSLLLPRSLSRWCGQRQLLWVFRRVEESFFFFEKKIKKKIDIYKSTKLHSLDTALITLSFERSFRAHVHTHKKRSGCSFFESAAFFVSRFKSGPLSFFLNEDKGKIGIFSGLREIFEYSLSGDL